MRIAAMRRGGEYGSISALICAIIRAKYRLPLSGIHHKPYVGATTNARQIENARIGS